MAAPIRVGIINDMADAPPGPINLEPWLRFAAEEVRRTGRLDRDVEFVQGYALGLPWGTAAAIERCFADLVRQDVLLIVGPAIGHNALVATRLAEQYRTPTLNWAGSEDARSPYMFHLQVGSHEEDPIVVARHLGALGIQRVGVVYDRSQIGLRHFMFFQGEADMMGVRISGMVQLSPVAKDATAEVDQLLAGKPDAIVYLGVGECVPAVAIALKARIWPGARVMNTAGIRGYAPGEGELIDGWTYLDQYSDHNTTLAAVQEREGAPKDNLFQCAALYDLGRLAAEGLARAPELTRDGVREGLEKIKWLPAAEGLEGTLLGFGKYDRGALHGRYLVVREWRDGKSVEFSA